MSRVQLALNVDDLDEAITFYSKLFNTAARQGQAGLRELRGRRATVEARPHRKPRPRWDSQSPRRRGGVQRCRPRRDRPLDQRGNVHRRGIGTTCCFATQDKVWVTGPAGEKWEVYTVLADSESFGTDSLILANSGGTGSACCTIETSDDTAGES